MSDHAYQLSAPADFPFPFANGFVLGGDNCANAGKLDNTQGMIFVR